MPPPSHRQLSNGAIAGARGEKKQTCPNTILELSKPHASWHALRRGPASGTVRASLCIARCRGRTAPRPPTVTAPLGACVFPGSTSGGTAVRAVHAALAAVTSPPATRASSDRGFACPARAFLDTPAAAARRGEDTSARTCVCGGSSGPARCSWPAGGRPESCDRARSRWHPTALRTAQRAGFRAADPPHLFCGPRRKRPRRSPAVLKRGRGPGRAPSLSTCGQTPRAGPLRRGDPGRLVAGAEIT